MQRPPLEGNDAKEVHETSEKTSSGQQPFFFIGFCANHIINLSNLNHIDYYRSTWLQIRFVTYWAGTI